MSDKITLWDRIRGLIGHVGYCMFLWSISLTHEEYLEEIYEGAKEELERAK
jgi:hypothetical protein